MGRSESRPSWKVRPEFTIRKNSQTHLSSVANSAEIVLKTETAGVNMTCHHRQAINAEIMPKSLSQPSQPASDRDEVSEVSEPSNTLRRSVASILFVQKSINIAPTNHNKSRIITFVPAAPAPFSFQELYQ